MIPGDRNVGGFPDDRPGPRLFLHSSFRTGSTWLWSCFRRNPLCYAYYEIFNETLATLDFGTINQSHRTWNSRHPEDAPYFIEFAPLLGRQGGVEGYTTDMSFERFFPVHGEDGWILPTGQASYVAGLIDNAHAAGRVPLLSCTRSLARLPALRQAFGGFHIVLRRSLLHQWFSCSSQAAEGNRYFEQAVLRTIFSETDDPVAGALRRFLSGDGAAMDAATMEVATMEVAPDDLFICFLVLHLYLDYRGARDADLVLDMDRLADPADDAFATAAVATILRETGLQVDLSGARKVVSAPERLLEDAGRIDHLVKSILLMALRSADPLEATRLAPLYAHGEVQMSALWTEYDRYLHYAGSAHKRWHALAKTASPGMLMARDLEATALRADLDAAIAEAAAFGTSRDELATRLASMKAEAGETSAALQAKIVGQQAQLATLEAEAKGLVAAADALHAALGTEAGTRDAAVAETARLQVEAFSLRSQADASAGRSEAMGAEVSRLAGELATACEAGDRLLVERNDAAEQQDRLGRRSEELAVLAEQMARDMDVMRQELEQLRYARSPASALARQWDHMMLRLE